MLHQIIYYLIFLLLMGCGGIKEENKATTPKIVITPTEISHQTKWADNGTWNKATITVSTFNIVDGKDQPTSADVKVSYTHSNVRVYDQTQQLVVSGASVKTNSAITLTAEYLSSGKANPTEYNTTIVFQNGSASATVTIKVLKPGNVTFSLKATPTTIEEKSLLKDTGTWQTRNVLLTLHADNQGLQDEIFCLVTNGKNVKLFDTKGGEITAGDVETDNEGKAIVIVKYLTQEGLKYSDSIQFFYGSLSATTAITVTAEEPIKVTTTVTPAKLEFTAPAEDEGTWRTANFQVMTKNSSNTGVSASVELSTSTQYAYIVHGGTDHQNITVQTSSNGSYTGTLKYFTKSNPTKVEYTASLTANEAVIPITIKGTDQPVIDYVITVAPGNFTYTYTGTVDKWQTQFFSITVTETKGFPVKDANITIISPHTEHTKLYVVEGVSYVEKPSPIVVKTDANGQYLLRLDYYTKSDYTVTPITKLLYNGQLIVTYKQFSKTVDFKVQ